MSYFFHYATFLKTQMTEITLLESLTISPAKTLKNTSQFITCSPYCLDSKMSHVDEEKSSLGGERSPGWEEQRISKFVFSKRQLS